MYQQPSTLSDWAGATERLFVRLLFISAESEQQQTFFTAGGPQWKDAFRLCTRCKGLNHVLHQHIHRQHPVWICWEVCQRNHKTCRVLVKCNNVQEKQNTPNIKYNVSLLYVFLNRGFKNHLVTTNYTGEWIISRPGKHCCWISEGTHPDNYAALISPLTKLFWSSQLLNRNVG